MARLLPAKAIPEFLTTYGATDFGTECPADKLTVKVWDKFGTKPEDEENAPGTGTFLAAVVICDPCEKHLMLDRAALSKG